MRGIVFSDLHLGNFRPFSRIDKQGYNTRLMNGILVLRQIVDYAKKNRIELILFCGDLLDKGDKPTPDILELLVATFRMLIRCKIRMVCLVGNHDQASLNGLINIVSPFRDYVTVIDRVENDLEIVGLNVVGMPARRDMEDLKAELKKCPENVPGKKGIFLGHFYCKEILEADVAGLSEKMECVEFSQLPQGFDYYFLGDYHRPVVVPELNLESVGAVMHHDFGDATRPQGHFIDIDFDTGEKKYIPVTAPMFVDVKDRKFPTKDDIPYDYYRVHVKDKKQRDKIQSKLDDSWNVKYIFESQPKEAQELRVDIDPTLTPMDAIQSYVEYLGGSPELAQAGVDYFQKAASARL